MAIEKATKINVLSQTAVITIFIFMLVTFVIPEINANRDEIKVNSQDIGDMRLVITEMDIEELDEKLDTIDLKLDKIILALCGEFGGKYCE